MRPAPGVPLDQFCPELRRNEPELGFVRINRKLLPPNGDVQLIVAAHERFVGDGAGFVRIRHVLRTREHDDQAIGGGEVVVVVRRGEVLVGEQYLDPSSPTTEPLLRGEVVATTWLGVLFVGYRVDPSLLLAQGEHR